MRMPPPVFEHCLITGASAGLGAAFARLLAPRARHLTLVARREARLRALAEELESRHERLEVGVVAADLAEAAGPGQVFESLAEAAGPVDLLVNNAGFGRVGALEDFPWADYAEMIDLNVRALSELSQRFLEQLPDPAGRGIIHVASCAGFQPLPYFGVYAATKAYVRSYSSALAGETRSRGLRVLSLCPGPVDTEFADVAGIRPGRGKPALDADAVVRVGLRAYERGRHEVIPGATNRLVAALTWLLPQSWVLRLAARSLRPS